MKRKRLIVRAVSLFMVGLITTLALVIPTSAIMAEYPTQDNVTYADCVMPFNVNFVGSDGSLDYVYSVPVGYNSPVIQTGVQGHDTLTGRVLGNDGVTANTATLEYYYFPTEWRIGYDGTDYGNGWGGVPVELRIDNTELNGKTIVIEAPTFYVNPLNSNWYNVANADTYNRWAIGAFRMPTLSDPTTQAYVGRYTVSANIVDDVGTKHPVSYSKVIDTRIDNDWIPMLEPSIFQEYVINDIQETGYNRIVAVTDFKAYVDCDYYEFIVPETNISFTVDGESFTTVEGTTWETFVESYSNDTFREFEGEIQFEVGTDIWAPISTDGTATNIVEPSDVIQSLTYLTYLDDEDDGIVGTWVFNSSVSAPSTSGRTFLIYSNASSTELCGRFFDSSSNYNLCCNKWSTSSSRWYGFQLSSTYYYWSTPNGDFSNSLQYLPGRTLIIYDDWLYDEAGLTWLKANATKQSSASTVTFADEPTSYSTDTPTTTADVGEWQLVENSSLKATGIDVSYPVYERGEFAEDLNLDYPDFNRYISKFRGVGNLDINADFTGWIATATSGFLNFELLPNFSIGGVLAILVGFSLVVLFLKIFAGG